jgi:RNA polymerase sigma-B factor
MGEPVTLFRLESPRRRASRDDGRVQPTTRPVAQGLSPREQRIIYLRFFEERTQSESAAQLGISQIHVSRLLTKSLATLRHEAWTSATD